MRYPPQVLEEIRARLPVSAVVGKRVRLKKAGREWRGLSPFNAEKTPSFYVNDQKQFYHCFSSGKHGDIFTFLMETEGLGFHEAVERLAAEAGVDAALVSYFFGSKAKLFVEVVELPFEPAQVLPMVFEPGPEGAGERLAQVLLAGLENPDVRQRLVGLVRAAASQPEAAAMVRELVARRMGAQTLGALGVTDADLRASLIGSQVVGLVMARYIVAVEPLASLPPAVVAAAIAPNLQRYLTGPLGRCFGL